ncbi:MAG: DsbA family protein [Gammaproteobacteria bacterium]|nr:DsbA family protein [Gammaproteobacteria bacterium]
MTAVLYYVHDPMCSWCWGFSSAITDLLQKLPQDIKVERLLGGLAKDSDVTMPESMQHYIKTNWSKIEDRIPGVKFNFDFWSKCTPRRSTYPACRAVIAARKQGNEFDMKMTRAIQQAYYQQARNPSDNSTLIELAGELGLAVTEFTKDLSSTETEQELINEINRSKELYAESYPSLVLVKDNESFTIPIEYTDSQAMLDAILDHINKN